MTQTARRARVISVIVAAALCLCAYQLFSIQVMQGAELAAEGQDVRTQATDVPARRGTIVDAKGTILADSLQAYHIAVNQVNLRQWVHYEKDEDGRKTDTVIGRGPAEAARLLAPLLEMDEAVLGGKLVGDDTYIYLKKNVDAVTYREIRKLDIHGIEWEVVHKRVYPGGSLAAPILGSVNHEGVGAAGLEETMDTVLQGTPGQEAYEIAPNGALIPGGKKVVVEPKDGATVRTTLHSDLQHLVQEKLDARVAQHEAEWGVVVVTEVSTGRILVMADSGSQHPNEAGVQPIRAVQYAVEPGSVGKVITLAAALDRGAVTPTTVFNVADTILLPDAGGPITDLVPHAPLDLTVTGILVQSSNVGTVLVGETISDQDRYDMMRRMGLGQYTGVELNHETAGFLRTPEELVGRDRYVSMFGQAYSMSALQEATVMASIGNGGVRVDPRIVDSWTLSDGTVHQPDPPEPVQVMTPETAAQVLSMMESVVQDETGTGGGAKVDGYRIGLKTGTAEMIDGGASVVVATAAGVVPIDAPRLAIAVVLYNPKVGYYGGSSAAPLLGDVAADAVRNLGIPASSQEATLYPTSP